MKNKLSVCLITAAIILMTFLSPAAHAASAHDPPDLLNAEAIISELADSSAASIPSVAVKVFDKDHDICTVIRGHSDIENNIPADEDTVYEWGSISKLAVWVSAMQLCERGQLSLDRDIRDYLPGDFVKKLRYKKPVTMLDLMNHCGGFQDSPDALDTDDLNRLMPLDKGLIKTQPAQVYEPGTVIAYSNWGAALAGYVVECVSGMSYADYVTENIFKPLGMEHTYIKPDISDNDRAAAGRKRTHSYRFNGSGLETLGECRCYIHVYPAGSIGGTLSDLAKFAKAFLTDSRDCPFFENEDTLDKMLQPSLCYSDGTPRICHGLMTFEYGEQLTGHGGSTTGFSSLLLLDLKNKTGFVFMTNLSGYSSFRNDLPEKLYGIMDIPEKNDPHEKLDLSGMYHISGNMSSGVMSLYDFLSERFIVREKDGAHTGNRGVISIRQTDENTAVVTLVTGAEHLFRIRKDASGNVAALENRTVDYVKISTARYYADVAVIILLLTALTMMIILLVLHIAALIIGRVRKETEISAIKFRKTELFACLSAAVIPFGAVFSLNILPGIFGIRASLNAFCAVNIVGAVCMAVFLVLCHLTKSKPDKKLRFIIENICGVCIIGGMIYWQLFQFC